jgi:SAM-dependent methyltransferase
VNDRTSEFFNRYAVDFDSIYGNDNKALERIANRLFRHAMLVRYQKTIAGCQPAAGRSVIDVGCGPGHYSITLARQGADKVLGLDFAPGMLKIARDRAAFAGVAERCSFELGDFLTYSLPEPFDYAIVMGFMDYVRVRAFFSFPKAGGPLAWQRQWRYRNRCDLFLYGEEQIRALLVPTGASFTIDPIGRDFFVTLSARKA